MPEATTTHDEYKRALPSLKFIRNKYIEQNQLNVEECNFNDRPQYRAFRSFVLNDAECREKLNQIISLYKPLIDRVISSYIPRYLREHKVPRDQKRARQSAFEDLFTIATIGNPTSNTKEREKDFTMSAYGVVEALLTYPANGEEPNADGLQAHIVTRIKRSMHKYFDVKSTFSEDKIGEKSVQKIPGDIGKRGTHKQSLNHHSENAQVLETYFDVGGMSGKIHKTADWTEENLQNTLGEMRDVLKKLPSIEREVLKIMIREGELNQKKISLTSIIKKLGIQKDYAKELVGNLRDKFFSIFNQTGMPYAAKFEIIQALREEISFENPAKFFNETGFSDLEKKTLREAARVFSRQYSDATKNGGVVVCFSKVNNKLAIGVEKPSDSPNQNNSDVSIAFNGIIYGASLTTKAVTTPAIIGKGFNNNGSTIDTVLFDKVTDVIALANALEEKAGRKSGQGFNKAI